MANSGFFVEDWVSTRDEKNVRKLKKTKKHSIKKGSGTHSTPYTKQMKSIKKVYSDVEQRIRNAKQTIEFHRHAKPSSGMFIAS